jgi:hypothetical protein
MTPEFRGISRMTNVVSPLAQLGKLTAVGAEAERVRGRPWLTAAKWARGTIENNELALPYRTEVKAVAPSPTFLSAAVAVLLVTGAASALSPMGPDIAADAKPVRARTADVKVAPRPAIPAERVRLNVSEPAAAYASVAETSSPIEQLAAAFAAAQAVKGSHLEATAVALTSTNDAAPQPLLTLAEQRSEPAAITSLYTAVLSGLPAGSRVSNGLEIGQGEWVMALDELDTVEIDVPSSVKRLLLAHVEIKGQDGLVLARFPLVVDPEGRIDTETVASVAVPKDGGEPARPIKVARLDVQPPQPVLRSKPQAKLPKDVVAATAPQQRRKTPAVRPAAPIIKPTAAANIPIDTAEADAASAAPIGTMPEGSAGLETFRTFSLLGAEKPTP